MKGLKLYRFQIPGKHSYSVTYEHVFWRMQTLSRLTGARAPQAPKLWVRATKVFFKEPEWAPKDGVFIPIQSVRWLQSSQEINQKNTVKKHSKINRNELPLWSCFAFITRNIDQNTAKKVFPAHKTAENSHSQSKNHSHSKIYRNELPLWYCFAFITRNIDQNTATKSFQLTKQ